MKNDNAQTTQKVENENQPKNIRYLHDSLVKIFMYMHLSAVYIFIGFLDTNEINIFFSFRMKKSNFHISAGKWIPFAV